MFMLGWISMSSRRLEDQFLKDDQENGGGGNSCPDAAEPTLPPTTETLTAEGTPASGTTYSDNAQDPQCTPETGEYIHVNKISFWSYMYAEMTRAYQLTHDEVRMTEKRQRVYTFIKIPIELEKFMTYGFFQCVDAFLYIFTFLPIRFCLALLHLCTRSLLLLCKSGQGRLLEPAQVCDLLKGVILVSCCVIMNYMDVSMMYHLIRGQAIIKLYIFFNMLEVADKLFSSFGQDILDSLFWTATEPRGSKREHLGVLLHLVCAVFYVFGHTVLVLFQATTLNVAFNSHNKALLTIMMSNNFVELKGSVFKKFEKNNLFQMSCSDVRERFHFFILLSIVCIRNLPEFSWNVDHFWVLIPDLVMVMMFEFLVDWVKHAFITKFNDIPAEVYKEYVVSIAYDMASSKQKDAFSDYMDIVSRRMGFIPMPLAVLLVRVLSQSLHFTGYIGVLLLVMLYLCLVTFKVLNSVVLLGLACGYINDNKQKEAAAAATTAAAQSKVPPVDSFSDSISFKRSDHAFKHLHRSHSISGSMNASLQEATLSPPVLGHCLTPSLTPKGLLSNSTVSLQSVGLNEEYVKDVFTVVSPTAKGTELKQRRVESRPAKPLSEIDRYTMCSNRII